MKKKLIALALTACMAMGVMAGCSDEGKDISELKMDEPEAHRYIEKQAMDQCISKRQVAQNIIKTYS